MNCIAKDTKGMEILMDYCAGPIDPVQSARIEEHLRECPECCEIVEAQRGLWQTLDAWKPIEVSPGFDAKLYARISKEQTAPWWLSWIPRLSWKPALSIAAVAAVLTLIVVVRAPDTPGANVTPSVQTQQAERIDIQEVQQALDDLDLLSPATSPL